MVFTECGISAIVSRTPITYHPILESLRNLQHRGREAFGVSYVDSCGGVAGEKRLGIVSDIDSLDTVESTVWMGHVRYSTAGTKECGSTDKFMESCQPILCWSKLLGQYGIAHNGNIPEKVWRNVSSLYTDFSYAHDSARSDTLLLRDLIEYLAVKDNDSNKYGDLALSHETIWKNVLITIMDIVPGACSLVIQTQWGFWAMRDRYGVRPLVMTHTEDRCMIASESVAFESSGVIENVDPGCIVYIPYDGMKEIFHYKYCNASPRHCVFEYLYFLRCNTVVDDLDVANFRVQVGHSLRDQINDSMPELIERWKNNDAFVCGVPTSGVMFGKGFSEATGLPYVQALNKRADYPWRTFILESNDKRIQACEKKFVVTPEHIEGKTLVLVDDSIVRGNTLTYLIKFIRMAAKPREIHIISGSPAIKFPCHYGVDFPDIEELFANRVGIEDMPKRLDVDSVTYFDTRKLLDLKSDVCHACFTGDYVF